MQRRALVIGAANGIGLATAQGLARFYDVVSGDIDNCDIRDSEQVRQFFFTAKSVNLIVNAVAVYSSMSMEEADVTEFDRVTETNMRGIFTVCREAIPYLRQTKGMLINIASAVGMVPDRNAPLYSASKAWVIHFTKCLALKYARERIRFNCICPGPTDTAFFRNACKNDPLVISEAASTNPLGRIAQPEEISRVVLAMANSKYTTGAVWTVDGGESINCIS